MKKQLPLSVMAMVAAFAPVCAFGQGAADRQSAAETAAAAEELARLRSEIQAMEQQLAAERQRIAVDHMASAQAALQAQMEAARVTAEGAGAQAALQEQMEVARAQLAQAARQVAEVSGQWGLLYSAPLSGDLRNILGMTMRDTSNGVVVSAVTPNGPAAEAGIAAQDVITAINDRALARAGGQYRALMTELVKIEPGESVALEMARGADSLDVVLTPRPAGLIELLPPLRAAAPLEPFQPLEPLPQLQRLNESHERLNRQYTDLVSREWPPFGGSLWDTMQLVTLTPTLGQYFGTEKGILVVRAPTDASLAALEDGDVILDIGGRVPTTPEHTMRIFASFEPGETLKIEVMRRERRMTVEAELPNVF
jgi:S1-C subfamily serine protease